MHIKYVQSEAPAGSLTISWYSDGRVVANGNVGQLPVSTLIKKQIGRMMLRWLKEYHRLNYWEANTRRGFEEQQAFKYTPQNFGE